MSPRPRQRLARSIWYAGTGVMDFDSDSDILESFPAALQTGIEYLTVALVASSDAHGTRRWT